MWELLVLAASALLKHQNDKRAIERQQSLRSAMEAYQRGKAKEIEAATEELIQKQTPQARADEAANITADRAQSLRDTVGAAQAFDAPGIAGKLSADYRSTDETTAAKRAERTRRAIEQMATMGEPSEQQQRFGLRFGKAAGTVDASNRAIENVGRAYTGAMSRVQPDPAIDLISQIGMGVGAGMLGSAGAGAATLGYTNTTGNGTNVVGYGGAGDVATAGNETPSQTKIRRGFGLWGWR